MKKNLFLATLLLLAAMATSCQPSREQSPVELALKDYVSENFDYPEQLKEITAVSLIDTFDLADISTTGKEIVDLSYKVDKTEDTIMNWLANKSAPYMGKLRRKVGELQKPLTTYYELIEKFAYSRSDLEKALKAVEGSENTYIHYELKARMKKSETKWIEVYHVYVDKAGEITFRKEPMTMGSVPEEWFELSNKVDSFVVLLRTKMDCIKELKRVIQSVGGEV